MRTELLETFVVVAEERHFGRAADRLHIGQSPLSQRIRRLEEEIGVPLFARSTRKVELTPAGRALLDHVPTLLSALSAAGEAARRADAGEAGRIALGFTGSATFSLMPSLTQHLRRLLPGVDLTLRGELFTPAQVEGLERGELDIGLLRPPVRSSNLDFEIVRREALIAVLPDSHPAARQEEVAMTDLADEDFIAYPNNARSVLHQAVEATSAAHGYHPRIVMEVAETATLVSFVAAGIGVSLVPESVADLTVAGAVYRPLAEPFEHVDLALAWRRSADEPVVARTLDAIRAYFAEEPSELSPPPSPAAPP